ESLVNHSIEEKTKAPSLSDFSKRVGTAWRKLDSQIKKEWNKKAQTEREKTPGYECGLCGKFFKQKKRKRFHEKQCGDELFCYSEGCGKTFKTKDLMKKHMKTHEENYTCKICNKKFGIKQTFLTHVKSHEKTFECDACGKRFGSKGNMVRHNKKHF
uniref:C2H2-type domain-containing protein n=1 Tax=Clytia hemisphaerica TaxID=252671 RepID=A0A7M5ULD3_9CNID